MTGWYLLGLYAVVTSFVILIGIIIGGKIQMKTASIIFILLGMFANFLYLSTLLAVIGFAVGCVALYQLSQDNKNVGIGVCALLFTSLIGGILYLCWKPEDK